MTLDRIALRKILHVFVVVVVVAGVLFVFIVIYVHALVMIA